MRDATLGPVRRPVGQRRPCVATRSTRSRASAAINQAPASSNDSSTSRQLEGRPAVGSARLGAIPRHHGRATSVRRTSTSCSRPARATSRLGERTASRSGNPCRSSRSRPRGRQPCRSRRKRSRTRRPSASCCSRTARSKGLRLSAGLVQHQGQRLHQRRRAARRTSSTAASSLNEPLTVSTLITFGAGNQSLVRDPQRQRQPPVAAYPWSGYRSRLPAAAVAPG